MMVEVTSSEPLQTHELACLSRKNLQRCGSISQLLNDITKPKQRKLKKRMM
jgi:hypothetical protein